MKIKLIAEITVACMALIILGVWQKWLPWPEGALMAAALVVVTVLLMVRKRNSEPRS